MASEVTRRNFLTAAGTVAVAGAVSSAQAAPHTNDGRIKIVAVCTSPRKGKSTAKSLEVCLEAAKKFAPERIETELIELAGMKIPGEVAAGIELAPGEKDDFPALVPKLTDAKVAGIIVGSPVYFGSMTALCKAFLDRCILFRKNNFALKDKVAGVVAVGGARNGGQELTISTIQNALYCQQMLLVGDGPPTAHRGGTVWSGAGDEVTDDEFGMNTCRNLGRRLAEVALHWHGQGSE